MGPVVWTLIILAIAFFSIGGLLLRFGGVDDREGIGFGMMAGGGILGIMALLGFLLE